MPLICSQNFAYSGIFPSLNSQNTPGKYTALLLLGDFVGKWATFLVVAFAAAEFEPFDLEGVN